MDTDARMNILERSSFFDGADRDVIKHAAETASELPIAKDDQLFRQGEEASYSYLLAWGRVRLDQTTSDGRNVVIRYLGPGDLIGTVAVLRRKPYPATPVAVEDGMALFWSAEKKAMLIAAHPVLATNAIELTGSRLEELQERLREVATQRVERRIAATLLRQVRHAGRRVEDGVEIPFTLTRGEIAELTATTLHTVSRTLAAWEQEGILSGKRASHLVITMPHRLVEIAEQE